mgnify:CR=1 FL=1
MKLNKVWKVIIGLVSLWVVLYPLIVVIGVFAMIPFMAITEGNSSPESIPFAFSGFAFAMGLMMLTSFAQMATSAFYLVHIILNKDGTDWLRALLGVGAFYLPYLALPFYYFVYILPKTPPEWALVDSNKEK